MRTLKLTKKIHRHIYAIYRPTIKVIRLKTNTFSNKVSTISLYK